MFKKKKKKKKREQHRVLSCPQVPVGLSSEKNRLYLEYNLLFRLIRFREVTYYTVVKELRSELFCHLPVQVN